jgi:hypothetical protein
MVKKFLRRGVDVLTSSIRRVISGGKKGGMFLGHQVLCGARQAGNYFKNVFFHPVRGVVSLALAGGAMHVFGFASLFAIPFLMGSEDRCCHRFIDHGLKAAVFAGSLWALQFGLWPVSMVLFSFAIADVLAELEKEFNTYWALEAQKGA